MSDIPAWLNVMRSALGTKEYSGDADNPAILAMRDEIKRIWGDVPGLVTYANTYQHDATPWCGLAAGWAVSEAGYMPPFKKGSDTDSFYWAQSFASDPNFVELSQPVPGAITVLTRSGGGHVSMYERTEGSNVVLTGGNQGDAVTTAKFPASSVIGYYWPKAAPMPPIPRRELEQGDTGSDVAEVQRLLLGSALADGDFGPQTKGAVISFQRATGLAADGEVGPDTWAKLDELDAKLKAGNDGLSAEQIATIADIAERSALADYNWKDRGKAPPGYIPGMALAYALAMTWLDEDDSSAAVMAQADTDDQDHDALTWYRKEFRDLGMDNSEDGIDTLRHLFVLLIGLGMRESSGNCWEGRDMSASNTSSDTCEAGLFQTSWNIRSSSPEFAKLLTEYWANPNGFNETFREGLNPTASQLDVYGSGQGAQYQWLARYAPAFAAMTTAVGLRVLRKHWGPIGRKEVQLRPEADQLLQAVQAYMEGLEPVPPEPPVPPVEQAIVQLQIAASGPVTVIVNGTPIGSI